MENKTEILELIKSYELALRKLETAEEKYDLLKKDFPSLVKNANKQEIIELIEETVAEEV